MKTRKIGPATLLISVALLIITIATLSSITVAVKQRQATSSIGTTEPGTNTLTTVIKTNTVTGDDPGGIFGQGEWFDSVVLDTLNP